MLIKFTDFNGADTAITNRYQAQWKDIVAALTAMPLHLKASDEAKIKGKPIFDPIGTNEFIKDALTKRGWLHKILIPAEYAFLGKDVDFGKEGVLAEVQFSNYPFLLKNLLRTELFYKSKIPLSEQPTGLLVVITKGKMFPAFQSTLYYEQARDQLTALAEKNVFDVPIRLVGLMVGLDPLISCF